MEEGKQETIDAVMQYVNEVVSGDRKMVVISVVGDELSVSLLGASFMEALRMLRGSYELALKNIESALGDDVEPLH